MDYKAAAVRRLHSDGFDKYGLPDISGLSIPEGEPQAKMRAFLKAAGNPYLFRVGDIAVHVEFSGTAGDALQDRLCHLLSKSI